MSLVELFIIAVGLSMDAFAVAICTGLSMKKPTIKDSLIVGLYFGIFQALMPLIGFLLGAGFADKITAIDHWIAFVVLAVIGGKMAKESFDKNDDVPEEEASLSLKKMLPLAIATSIDALAVGVTFAFINVSIVPAVTFIGVCTLLISMAGVKIGNVFGLKFKSKAELAGGLILILMGGKILVEHLGLISF